MLIAALQQGLHLSALDLAGLIAEGGLTGRVEGVNAPVRIHGHDGIDGGVQDGAGDLETLGQLLLGRLAVGDVQADAKVAPADPLFITDGGDHQGDGEAAAILAHIGPLPALRPFPFRLVDEHLETADLLAVLGAELDTAGLHLVAGVEDTGGLLADHVGGAVSQQLLGPLVEQGDGALQIGRYDGDRRGGAQDVAQ